MWELRNATLHGSNASEIREQQLKTLHLQIDQLYNRAKVLAYRKDKELHAVFKMTRKTRKKQGLVALHSWIKLANAIVIKVEKGKQVI